MREYLKNDTGEGYVDSGLVMLGIGSAATIVGVGTMYQFDENRKGNKIRQTVEALGLPFKISDRKIYLFGTLPMADAFICWRCRPISGHFQVFSFACIMLDCLFLQLLTFRVLEGKRPFDYHFQNILNVYQL